MISMDGVVETGGITITLPRVMAALSDPTRIGLVRVLGDGSERPWNHLRVKAAKSTLSHHLRVLREAGLTETRREGTRCFVRLRTEELCEQLPGLLPSVLALAEAEGVGDSVVAMSRQSTAPEAGLAGASPSAAL